MGVINIILVIVEFINGLNIVKYFVVMIVIIK